MRKRCRLDAVLVVALFVVASGGCAVGPVAGRAPSPDVLARAGLPETGRFSLQITANGAEQHVLFSAEGVFDHRHRRYVLDVDGEAITSSAYAWAAARRTIAVGDVVYLDAPGLAQRLGVTTPWISVRTSGGDDVLHLRSFDPSQVLEQFHSPAAEVERDDHGLVRRVTVRFDAPGDDGVVLTVAYSDLGAPVTVEPPSADQVTDVTGAVNRHPRRPTGG